MLLSDYIASKKVKDINSALKAIEGKKIVILTGSSNHGYIANKVITLPSALMMSEDASVYLNQRNRNEAATGITFEYAQKFLPTVEEGNRGYAVYSRDIMIITTNSKKELNASKIAAKVRLSSFKEKTEKEIKDIESKINLMDSLKIKEYDEAFNDTLDNLTSIKDSFKNENEFLSSIKNLHEKFVKDRYKGLNNPSSNKAKPSFDEEVAIDESMPEMATEG
jgi:hypothetical protein